MNTVSELMKQGWAQSPLSGVTSHPLILHTKLMREKSSKNIQDFD